MTIRRYRLFLAVLAVDAILAVFRPSVARHSVVNTLEFLWDVVAIVPTVMVLIALFDVWIPRHVVERSVGAASGVRGVLLTIMLGTAAAGPLYAAFPVARSLHEKGARLANVAIFLGVWGTIKIPMILLESSYVGVRFALLRLALTLPGVIAIGFLVERMAGAVRSDEDIRAQPDVAVGGGA